MNSSWLDETLAGLALGAAIAAPILFYFLWGA